MWTWEVSTATKRMSRVHCCKRHITNGQQRTDRRGHTVLTGAIAEVPSVAVHYRSPGQVAAHDATRTRDQLQQHVIDRVFNPFNLPPGTSFNLFL